MIKITTKAIDAYNKEKLNFNTDTILRINVAGVGWGGPSFKIVLEELKTTKNDIVEEYNGVKIAYDNSLKSYIKNIVIDHSKLWIFGGFYISNNPSGC